ncbi:MAG: guanylate kinase [Candidatus Omnitrophota bacterium]|jgi:guanylate kinase
MKKGKIIILSGPSGSGKTTLYQKLLTRRTIKNKLIKTPSVTTRPRRDGEKHGRDYFFVSKKMFLHKKRLGQFLESEKVFGNYYGTPNKNVRDLLLRGKNVLLCIDVKGAKTVRRKFPRATTVFIKTPSLKTLETRLKKRGSEQKNVLRERLRTARVELKEAKTYDHVVVNDTLRKACQRLEAIILKEIGKEICS